jgi:hypothetical protein
MTLEGVEMPGPQTTVRFEPHVEWLEPSRFDAIDAVLRGGTARDELKTFRCLDTAGQDM